MTKLAAFSALALAALALAACGGGSDSSTATGGGESTESQAEQGTDAKEEGGSAGGGTSVLKFEADPDGELAYTQTEVAAKAGKVKIDFHNPQPLPHNVVFEDASGKDVAETEAISDDSESINATLKPGTYHYFCSIAGHREAGMEGVLVVE